MNAVSKEEHPKHLGRYWVRANAYGREPLTPEETLDYSWNTWNSVLNTM